MSEPKRILAIDVGEARIGLALANDLAKLPRPLDILANDSGVYDRLALIIAENKITKLVVGFPRNMSGEETKQTRFSREFAEKLASYTNLPIDFADESLSTVRANSSNYRLDPSGYSDSIAACFILEEYLENI